MAGTIVVARVAVRVYPDTKLFRKELQADLKAMQDVEVEVPVRPKLDNETANRVKAEIDAKFSEITVKIKAALDTFSVDAIKARLDAAFAGARTATINTDLSAASVAKVRAEMAAMFAKHQAVKIKPTLDKKAAALVLAWFARLSGAQMLTHQIKEGIDAFKKLPGMVPGLILMVPAIAVVTAAILNMGGALLSLGRDAAKAVPILLAVPTVFMGMGLTLTTLFVAFKGLGKYLPEVAAQFSNIKNIMRDSFWGTALAPMEQAFTTMLPKINAGMAKVGASIGIWFSNLMQIFANTLPFETFFNSVATMNIHLKAMNQPLADIFKVFFDMSQWLLPSFADGLSNLTKKLSTWLNAANDSGKLQGWITGAVQKFKDFWGLIIAVYDWLNALTRPLEALNKMTIDSLADSFRRGAAAMNSAIGQINIKKVFESAQIAMRNFWSNSNAGMSEFFDALPDFLMKALPKLGAAGGTLGGAILGGLKGAMPGILEFFDAIAGAVELLAPQIKEAVTQIGATLGKDLGAMVKGFAPLLNDLLKMFNSVIGLLGSTITHLSHGLQMILDPLMPYVNKIIQVVGKGINEIAAILDDLMTFLAPYITDIVKHLVPVIQKAIDGIIPILRDLAGIIKQLAPIITPILTWLLDLVGTILDIILPTLDYVIKYVANVMDTISKIATTFMLAFEQMGKGDFIGAFKTLKDGIGTAIDDFNATTQKDAEAAGQRILDNLNGKNAKVDSPTAIDRTLTSIDEHVAAVTASIEAHAAVVNQTVTDMEARVTTATHQTQTTAGSGWEAVPAGMNVGLSSMPGVVSSWLIATSITIAIWFASTLNGFGVFNQAFSKGWNAMWSSTLATCKSFGGMLQAANNAVWSSIGSAISWFLNGIKSSVTSSWNSVVVATQNAWHSLPHVVQGGVNAAVGVVASLPGRCISAVGGLGGALIYAGISLMGGFLAGVRSMIGVITRTLDAFTASLPFHKGPIELDRVMFKPAGIAIMQSLMDGFEDGAKGIWDYLDDFTKELAGTEFAATLSANGSLVTNAMNAAGNAAVNATGANAGPSVQVTNYYPQAEPTSRTVNRALQLATLYA